MKSSDGSNNPYLALGGLLAAGLDGIQQRLELSEPVQVDPANLSDAEREARGIRRLPQSLGEALDALERDRVLSEALGPLLLASFVAVKRGEITDFIGEGMDYELRAHARTF